MLFWDRECAWCGIFYDILYYVFAATAAAVSFEAKRVGRSGRLADPSLPYLRFVNTPIRCPVHVWYLRKLFVGFKTETTSPWTGGTWERLAYPRRVYVSASPSRRPHYKRAHLVGLIVRQIRLFNEQSPTWNLLLLLLIKRSRYGEVSS